MNPGARQGPGFLAGTIAFSPDGKFVAAARNTPSERGVFVVTIWDGASGAELATLPSQPQHIEHTGVITALAFSPDGRTLATASLDHSVRLWDFAKRERIATMHGHLTEVWALAFAPDGQVLASGGKDGEVKLWTLQREPKIDGLASASMPLGIAKDGKTLIALAGNDSVGIFDAVTGEIKRRIGIEPMRSRFPVMGLTTSADGRWLVQSQADGTVKIWNTENGEARSLKVSDGPLFMLALSPDGSALIAAAREQPARWWNVATGESSPWPGEVMRVQFSPDGQTIAALQRDSTVQLWDVATRTLRVTVSSGSEFGGAGAFSPDGKRYAAPGPDDTILLWDSWNGELLGTFSGHKQPVFSVAFSPDGKTLASSSDDSTVRFWNVATRQELLAERRLGGSLSNLLFSPDGSLLVGSGRGTSRPGTLHTYRAPLFTVTDQVPRSLEAGGTSGAAER